MPKIHFTDHLGQTRTVAAAPGESVMEAAMRNSIPGIDADCGGACACATCHVFLSATDIERLPPRSDMESAMLEFAENANALSRLACQIKITPDLGGLTLFTPERQQ